jgi:hypothetical protein
MKPTLIHLVNWLKKSKNYNLNSKELIQEFFYTLMSLFKSKVFTNRAA